MNRRTDRQIDGQRSRAERKANTHNDRDKGRLTYILILLIKLFSFKI